MADVAAKAAAATTPSERKINPQALAAFLKRLIEDIDTSLQSAAEETLDVLKHCKDKCCRLLKSSEAPDVRTETLREMLQETAHVVLDYSFQDETLLVDSEFPADSANSRVTAVQEQLDSIFQLTKDSFQNESPVETLGKEIVECVHWRKGALFYMYCHTVCSDNRPMDAPCYKQCLEEGVSELEKMLSTRRPITVPDDISSNDTLQLFNHGVYSDMHLLAMMYAGELCYWHQQAADRGRFDPHTDGTHTLCAWQRGLTHLQSYLAAVNGPLKNYGWDTTRAEEFVQYLQQHRR